MNFSLNEEQRAIRDMARDFAEAEMAPFAAMWDEKTHFSSRHITQSRLTRISRHLHQPDLGGSGLSRLDSTLFLKNSPLPALLPQLISPFTTWRAG